MAIESPLRIDAGQPLTAWRLIHVDAFREAWLAGVPADRQEGLLLPGWFEQWATVTASTDPGAAEPGTIRAPVELFRMSVSIGSPTGRSITRARLPHRYCSFTPSGIKTYGSI